MGATHRFDGFTSHRAGPNIRIYGLVRPSPLSSPYRIRISYALETSPRVHVLSPEIRPRVDGEPIPHVYPGNELCLFAPGEWSGCMEIACTIVPWTIEWLFFYEAWHATGCWEGGGIDHG